MSISPNDTAILEILAMTVFADKRVYAAEIVAFLKEVTTLQKAGVLETELSEAKALAWYEMNKDGLQARLKLHELEFWIEQVAPVLAEHPHRQAVQDAMVRIAQSDGEQHVSERALEFLVSRRKSA